MTFDQATLTSRFPLPLMRAALLLAALSLTTRPLAADPRAHSGSPDGPPKRSTNTEASAATQWRWIGIRAENAEQCPEPIPARGWRTASLFPETENRALRRFCLYERDQAGETHLIEELPLAHLDPDLMGISGQGSDLANASWKALESQFLTQAGQVALPPGPPSTVRLTVVDTAPTETAMGATGPEDRIARSPHGTALLNMARDLVCDDAELSCRATLASRLAMAWTCFDGNTPGTCRDVQHGGYIGLIGELAQALHVEVTDWWGLSERGRLVLNLSLGWHESLGGGQTNVDDMPTPAQATYRVLEDAVCRGVLPIVAAGNRDASSSPQSGPFLPALWEARNAPSADDCRRLGLAPARHRKGGTAYRPLVFSVAGIETTGDRLDFTRQDGVSRLAAFGDHAVVARSNSGAPTGTLTGSSVAALVVSATAATLWSYQSTATAFEIMEAIYQHGTPTGRDADYCLGHAKACPSSLSGVQQVSLCATLASTCGAAAVGGVPPTCPAVTCPAVDPLDLSSADLTAFDALPRETDLDTLVDDLGPQAACADETILYDKTAGAPRDPCPHRQYDGPLIEPWTEPQPDSIPCPNCVGTFASPGTLYIEIDDQWRGALTSATLVCGTTSYALGLGPLRAGDKARLIQVPETCLTAFPTFLSFVHGADRAVLSPIQLCQGCC